MKQFDNTYYFWSDTKITPNDFFKKIIAEDDRFEVNNDLHNFKGIKIYLPGEPHYFSFKYIKTNYECNYSIDHVNAEKNVFKVNISLTYLKNKEQGAFAFSELIRSINICNRSQFNMIVLKDSLSTYYSGRLYSKLATYERSLRALILSIFIPLYSQEWISELEIALNREALEKNKLKPKLKNSLEELDLNHLEIIFFEPLINIDKDNYDSKFEIENLESLTKEQLIGIIRVNRPLSLWEKNISKYASDEGIKDKMIKIRDLRNRIAHNKPFSDNNYKNLNKHLNFIIPKINEAETKILESHNIEVLSNTLKHITENMSVFNNQFQLKISEALKTISDTTKKIIPSILASNLSSTQLFGERLKKSVELQQSITKVLNNYRYVKKE